MNSSKKWIVPLRPRVDPVIREALRTFVGGKNSRAQSWKRVLAPLRELEQHWVGQWDSADIIRYYRDTRYGREDRS